MSGTEVLCPHCETQSSCSASDLYAAKVSGKKALIVCGNCGRVSETKMNDLPPIGGLELVPWSENLPFDGEGTWLPCIPFTGPEGKLPAGAHVGPGDEASPRLWLYKTAKMDESPDGTTWWKWDDYVRKFGYDPFQKLKAMRGWNWVVMMTKGQEPHVRTRVILA